ncbi:MAG: ATP-binding protein, partial [Actinomycetes bacterium]
EEVREALTISPHIPITRCDARVRESVKETLITLVEHALAMRMAVPGGGLGR